VRMVAAEPVSYRLAWRAPSDPTGMAGSEGTCAAPCQICAKRRFSRR
jgi:hypothetical protein